MGRIRKINNKGTEEPTEVILLDRDNLSLTYMPIIYILYFIGVADGPEMEIMRKMNNKGTEEPTEVILID